MFTQQYPIILASTSPRRKQILKDAGFDFLVLSKNVEEVYFINEEGMSETSINYMNIITDKFYI